MAEHVAQAYSFTDFTTNTPNLPFPGNKVDEELAIIRAFVNTLADRLEQVRRSDGFVQNGKVTEAALDAALTAKVNGAAPGGGDAEAWNQLAAAWAENMPSTIPDNLLGMMSVTGDHWSARWWANRAAQLVSQGIVGPYIVSDRLTIETKNVIPNITKTWNGEVFVLFLDGKPLFAGGPTSHFLVAGQTIAWVSTIYDVYPGAEVIVQYDTREPVPLDVLHPIYKTERLVIATENVIPDIAETWDGNVFWMSVNGRVFAPGGASPHFSVSGKAITWSSTSHRIYPGDEVWAFYTYGGNTI